MRYEDDIIKYYYHWLKEWLDNPKRKPANMAFTAGLSRDITRLMEDAMKVREEEILKMIERFESIFWEKKYRDIVLEIKELKKQIKGGN